MQYAWHSHVTSGNYWMVPIKPGKCDWAYLVDQRSVPALEYLSSISQAMPREVIVRIDHVYDANNADHQWGHSGVALWATHGTSREPVAVKSPFLGGWGELLLCTICSRSSCAFCRRDSSKESQYGGALPSREW